MTGEQIRLFIVCVVVGAINAVLFCIAAVTLLRLLRAGARDAHNSPRRRLLALDDGGDTRSSSQILSLLRAFWPWTTQKALLLMLTLATGLRIVWVVIAFIAWGTYGDIDSSVGTGFRIAFYSLDGILAATGFTLYAVVARFWADLAYASRQGTGTPRPIGGGDEYRPRGRTPLILKIAPNVQRCSSFIVFAAAIIATLLQILVVTDEGASVSTWTSFVEAGVYIVAAILIITSAHYAVVELRLVPIELPTRRRRVCHVGAVTISVAVCLFVRAVVLIMLAGDEITIANFWDVLGILAYWGLLDALPLAIVLAHNRMAPLSTSTSAGEARRATASYRRGPSVSEEEPLIAGSLFGSHVEDDNPFTGSRPGVHL